MIYKYKTPVEFFNSLQSDEQSLILEIAYQIYGDGNLYEWFCNIVDINTDLHRDLFERLESFMEE